MVIIWKYINAFHHINRLKNNILILIDAEVFHKAQNSLIIENFSISI